MTEMSFFRKAPAPTKGPAFEGATPDWFLGPTIGQGGSPVLMFDLSKLTWMDYEEMRWHPQVNASLSLMTFMLHQCDWKIECEDKRIAEVVEENMRLIWTQLVRGLSQAYTFGYSPMVLEWDNVGKRTFISKVRDLHPAEAEVEWREEESHYDPPPKYQNVVKPKIRIYDGIKKHGLSYPIPPEHTLWYPLLREHNNFTGRKLLKSAFAPWFFSHLIHLYSNRYFERFGEPVPIGRYPSNETHVIKNPGAGDDEVVTSKQVMEGAILNLRSGTAVLLPSDRDESASGINEFEYSLEYLESQMRGADFERYMSRLDEEISLAIFTPLLLMRSGDHGSLNLGVQHTKTYYNSLNGLTADIKEYVDAFVCERIKAFNFSEKSPRCEWVPRPLGRDNDETIRAMISAMITGGTAKPDIEEMGVALGMKLTEIEAVAPVAPAAAGATDLRDRSGRPDTGSRAADGPKNTARGTTPKAVRA